MVNRANTLDLSYHPRKSVEASDEDNFFAEDNV